MLTGTAMAQAIPLLISPLLTRIYTPQAFGLQTLFMGWAGTLGVAATLRLDLAAILPQDDKEAKRIASVALLVTVILTAVLVLAAAVGAAPLAALLGHPSHTHWIWALTLMVPAISITQLCSAFASRERAFKRIAKANVLNQALYAAIAITIGLLYAHPEGLVIAKLAGQGLTAATLLIAGGYAFNVCYSCLSWVNVRRICQQYRQFIIFNTPYSLIGTVARDMPIFVFSAVTASAAAGFYGLARTVLLAPALLLSSGLSQVFFREAVALKNNPRLENLTLGMLKMGTLAGAPLFAFMVVWGDIFFETLFGSTWREAGVYAMVLAPTAWMSLQTGWPERLFEVAHRQDVSFRIQIGADLITSVVVIMPLALGLSPFVAVCAFSSVNVIYHTVYLKAIFRVSGFIGYRLTKTMLLGWIAFGLSCSALLIIRLVPFASPLLLAIISAIAAGIAAALIGLKGWRNFAPSLNDKDLIS